MVLFDLTVPGRVCCVFAVVSLHLTRTEYPCTVQLSAGLQLVIRGLVLQRWMCHLLPILMLLGVHGLGGGRAQSLYATPPPPAGF